MLTVLPTICFSIKQRRIQKQYLKNLFLRNFFANAQRDVEGAVIRKKKRADGVCSFCSFSRLPKANISLSRMRKYHVAKQHITFAQANISRTSVYIVVSALFRCIAFILLPSASGYTLYTYSPLHTCSVLPPTVISAVAPSGTVTDIS